MKIYFTFRFLTLGNNFFNPQYIFDNAFIGMPFTYKYICGDITKDGRHLGMVEYNGPLTESEVVQLLSEALAPYAFHVKTSDSALAFAKYITGFGDDKVYFDANGYLIIDYPVPN